AWLKTSIAAWIVDQLSAGVQPEKARTFVVERGAKRLTAFPPNHRRPYANRPRPRRLAGHPAARSGFGAKNCRSAVSRDGRTQAVRHSIRPLDTSRSLRGGRRPLHGADNPSLTPPPASRRPHWR